MKFEKPVLKLVQPHQDGIGSQALRILSGYSIAKKWNLDFFYEPITKVDSQLFGAHAPNVENWNLLLQNIIHSDSRDLSTYSIKRHSNHRLELLWLSIEMNKILGNRTIHEILHPHSITNRSPKFLSNLIAEDIHPSCGTELTNKLRIVLHVRQGVLALSQFRDRLTPLAVYESILQDVCQILELFEIPFEVIIPVEPGQDSLVPAAKSEIQRSLRMDPSNPKLQYIEDGMYRLVHEQPTERETPRLSQATWINREDLWADFNCFLSADVFIMAKSSLSYLAAILNKSALKLYNPFWHPPLDGWYSIENSDVTKASLEKEILKILSKKNFC